MNSKELVNSALTAMKMAYAPYSNFSVGAALIGDNGKIYTGCNVENASYGLTICAERVAVFQAASDGVRKINNIAIVSSSGEATYPCGACRQVLNEFTDSMQVFVLNGESDIKSYSLNELLPNSFGPSDLNL